MAATTTTKKRKVDSMSGLFSIKSTPCEIIKFQFGDILNYCEVLDKVHNVNNNYRFAMQKGEDLFCSDFITAIHFIEDQSYVDRSGLCSNVLNFHFKCKVKAEMKKRESYIVESWITKDNKVLSCKCECAGGAEPACCKHAFGLLYALHDYSKKEMYSAPTEKLQAWHRPAPFVVSPKKTKDCFKFKTASVSQDPLSSPSSSVVPNVSVNYDALLDLPSVTPFFSACIKSGTSLYSVFSYKKSIPLPDFQPDIVTNVTNDFTFLSEYNRDFFNNNVLLSLDHAQMIEHDTRTQGDTNLLWLEERKKRLTASNVFKIIDADNPSDELAMKALAEKLFTPTDVSNVKPVVFGKLREPMIQNIIRHTYNYKEAVFRETGLCIHPQYPFIGGSPDGFIFDGQGNKMIVEIKTVFNVKKKSLKDLVKERKCFCIVEEDGEFKVNKNHAYYYQMQCQMFSSNVHVCLFALFYAFGEPLFTERVQFDSDFWSEVFLSLKNFYFQYYLPKLASLNQ